MPSPQPPRSVSLRDFDRGGTWKPRRKTASGHPPRARQLVELMTLGPPDGSRPGMTLPEAAAAMGIKNGTARSYLHLPASRQMFLQFCAAIREGEIPANLRAAIEIRDNKAMKASAAGSRAIIEAARYIERGGDKAQGVTVNVNTAIGVATISPGYMVSISEDQMEAARKLLKRAHSTRSVLEDVAGSPPPVIDHDGADVPASPQSHPADSAGPAFGHQNVEQYPPLDSRRRAPLLPTDDVVDG